MGKVKKSPPKRLAPPTVPVRDFIANLVECSEDAIPNILSPIHEWPFARGDLFHWIGVLNKFDSILENICVTYELKKLQTNDFTAETKALLKEILRFSRMLLENCTNRNLYSSAEHLNDLLNTSDMEILEANLRLILRPAQRLSNQRSLRTNFSISQERILDLVHGWGTREFGIEFVQLSQEDLVVPEELANLNFQFYRTLKPPEVTAATVSENTKIEDTGIQNKNKGQTSLSVQPISTSSQGKLNEGLIQITLQNVEQVGKSDKDIWAELVQQYQVPEEFHYSLYHRIRVVLGITNPAIRKKLLVIRILALAIMGHVISENTAQSKVFMYEPDVSANLAALINPDNNITTEIRTVALYALDSIARYRNKITEVLAAVNASANHGVLLYVLRKVVADIDADTNSYSQDFLDALFSFISYIITTQTGGQMVMTAGIIPTLLQTLHNKYETQLKNVTKAVGLLDSMVYGFANSFQAFVNAGGLTKLVGRIKDEIDICVQLIRLKSSGSDPMDVEPMTASSSRSEHEETVVPHERTTLLKAMFKFVLHMMQTAGNADGLRNLIDSTLPQSLKIVLENPKVFGSSVFALSINLMSTFIHNEPTSLPILQEAKLPQSFLETVKGDIPASADVISAIPNAFGAICLNAPGLEMFNTAKPISHFFTILTSIDHLRSVADGDMASLLGSSFDELMRHHPSLKGEIIEAIMEVLRRIQDMGQLENARPDDENYVLLPIPSKSEEMDTDADMADPNIPAETEVNKSLNTETSKPEEKEAVIIHFMDVAFRFLEGMFQNNSHCREFIKQGGVELLLSLYKLPVLPYDFVSTSAAISMSHLIRLISDVNPNPTVREILTHAQKALDDAGQFIEYDSADGILVSLIDVKDSDPEKLKDANGIFRKLIYVHSYVGLLCDVFIGPVFSHGKSAGALVQEIVGTIGEQLIPLLGRLHRVSIWENIVLKRNVPKSWYTSSAKLRKPETNSNEHKSTLEKLIDDLERETVDASEARTDDPKVKNTRYLNYLVTEIATSITPIFQGLTKMLLTRRVMDTAQKKQALKVGDMLTDTLIKHIDWPRIQKETTLDKYTYVTVILSLFSLLFVDDRSQSVLQTILVVSFDRKNATDELFKILRDLWRDAVTFEAIPESEKDQVVKDKIDRVYSSIETLLTIFQILGSWKHLLDSPQTAAILSKEKDIGTPEYFNSYDWLISIRLKLLSVIKELWEDDHLQHCPPSVIRGVMLNMVQLIKGENEQSNQRPEAIGSVGTSQPVFISRPTIVPDEAAVQSLVDMGFPRGAAETALLRCANRVDRAADYLLTHPETVAAAHFAEAENNAEAGGPSSNAIAQTVENSASDAVLPDPSEENPIATPSAMSAVGTEVVEAEADATQSETSEDDEDELQAALALSMIENDDIPMDATMEAYPTTTNNAQPAVIEQVPVNEEAAMDTEEPDSSIVVKEDVKGKKKEVIVTKTEKLKTLREEIKSNLAPRLLEMLDISEESIFEIKDLFAFLCKDDADKTLNFLLSNVDSIRIRFVDGDEAIAKALSIRMRLLALLFREQNLQKRIPTFSADLFPTLYEMVGKESSQPVETSLPSWLAPILLVMECFISQVDEPDTVELDDPQKPSDKDTVASKESGSDKWTLSDEKRLNLLEYCMRLMDRIKPTRDNLHAILRIIVRLTRRFSAAVYFVEKGGLRQLFSHPKTEAEGFQGQQAFIMLILRHIIEDTQVLQNAMEKEITTWFTNSRPRQVDITTYVRNNAAVGLRDPGVFVEATKAVCKLKDYESSGRTHMITLARNSSDQSQTGTVTSEATEEKDNAGTSDSKQSSIQPPLETPKKTYITEASETVVHFLINELLTAASVEQLSSPQRPNDIEMDDSAADQSPTKLEENRDLVYKGFLLQCLVELLSSYPSCKIDVMNYNSKASAKAALKPRSVFLNYLLNDLLPPDTINIPDELPRKRIGLSNWAASVIVALCSNGSQTLDGKQQPELIQVRRFVLDGVLRSFKDAISLHDIVEVRYGKMLALADLCHRILNARANVVIQSGKSIEDMPTSIAKIMLEKAFVGTLTSALAEIDVNYPNSKIVVNAILRPLEQLTKIAIKMGRLEPAGKDGKRRTSDGSLFAPTSEHPSESEDTPDLYRHSALGIFESGGLESEGEEEGTTEEEEGFEEGDYEETGSDMSDMSELSEEDSGITEEDGGEEEEDGMDVHFHHSGEEDEDDNEEEEEEEEVGRTEGEEFEDGVVGEGHVDDDMAWEDVEEDRGLLIQTEGDEADSVDGDLAPIRRNIFNEADDEVEQDNMMVDEEDPDAEGDGELEDDAHDNNPEDRIALDISLNEGDDFAHEEELNWGGRPRSFMNLGRRHARAIHVRGTRAIFETNFADMLEFQAGGGPPGFSFFEDGSEFQVLGRSFNRNGPTDDIATHPLLANRGTATTQATGGFDMQRPSRGARDNGLRHIQAIEDLIGGSAVQLLETLLNRRRPGGFPHGNRVRLEYHGPPPTGLQAFDFDGLFSQNQGNSGGHVATSRNNVPHDALLGMQDFSPMSTLDRWSQECRMMYGSMPSDKASRLANPVLNALVPLAIEEEKLRKEKEKKNQLEKEQKEREKKERKEKEDQERKDREKAEKAEKAEQAEREAQELARQTQEATQQEEMTDVQVVNTEAPVLNTDSIQEQPTISQSSNMETTIDSEQVPPSVEEAAASGSSSASSAPRTTVVVNGSLIDITNTGIDPEFLEALPEELRMEVISQHFREQVASAPQTFDPTFLEALPPELQSEILQEQERLQRQQQRNDNQTASVPADMDPASFLASLDPMLRQTVLMEQDDTFLATLPPAIVAEATALRERARTRYTSHRPGGARANFPVINPTTPKKPIVHKDAVQLVDRPQLATLVRLLFLPQSPKSLLHKLLLNLCENSKTRGDLVSLLLTILQDGSGDLSAVDKGFSQLSLKGKVPTPKNVTRARSGSQSAIGVGQSLGENVPNLIAQRCLEALSYIVTYNEQAVNYFLTENDGMPGLKRSSSKKGKEKGKAVAVSKYPIVILLSLLDRPVFTKSTMLMEQLTHLLAAVCRPLSTLGKKDEDKANQNDLVTEPPSNGDNLQSVSGVQIANATNFGENAISTSATTEGIAAAASSVEVTSDVTASSSSAGLMGSSGETPSNTEAAKIPKEVDRITLKPPVIPEQYLRLVVKVLTAGECSSKTFSYTLSLIQHLSSLEGARDVITSELISSAQNLGNSILEDLIELGQALENVMTGVSVQGTTLSKFSQSSSDQAKLLRVLKTIDYMYSRKQHIDSGTALPLAPSAAPAADEAILPSSSLSGDGKNSASALTPDEEKLLKIYNDLSFTPLWKKLSYCLTHVHEKDDMVHVSTVLLPLIESFMVVCRYAGVSKALPPVTPSTSSRPNPLESDETFNLNQEELFIDFTNQNRRILNILVRNNPSLMSGSFSLLVRNPKMLEFDNKRNYFNQQLHKRGTRDHFGTLQLNVRRLHVFEDSFHQLQGRTGDEIKYGKLSVRFYEEEGVDAGGVTREWFSVLARQMFNPNYALFKTSAADRLTYQPNRASWVNPDHLSFFKFVGRVIGKAIYDGRLLDAYFTRSFYKHILGRPVDYRDVEAIDPEYYKSLVWMLENDITDIIDLTFSVDTDDFGKSKTVDLKPSGRDIPVTEENKHEYVKLISEQKLTLAIKDQIKAYLEGFHEIIPPHLVSIFNEQELELLISGLPDIDLDDWKSHTEYQGYTPASPQVQWFWRAVRSFDQEERAKLLQFVTGTSKVPLEGFNALQGANGVQRFQIHKDYSSTNRLPSAHTCFNQIDLPAYDSYETLRSQLLTAISECSTGFGFG